MKRVSLSIFMSLLLACMLQPAFAQMASKKPVGDAVYAVYKEKGIDKALEEYQTLKKKKAADYTFDEQQLNAIGYKLMNTDNDMAAAKKVFWLNMQEYPSAVNPKDSYADVLVRMGEKDEARTYYKAAIEEFEKKNDFERNVSRNAKSKLALLDKKHQTFTFLTGSWAMEGIYWNEQNKEQKDSGDVTFSFANDMVMIVEMKQHARANSDIPGSVWVITYNAQRDVYETAWVDPSQRGLQPSVLTPQAAEGNKQIYLEEFTEDDTRYVLRHEIIPQGNTVQWTMFESKNGQDFRKMYQMDMSRQELSKN
ncbi:hypothetical protein [Cesiribacter andamanensis]|uniref:Uncharacterized protein n=1 Tax=Cesiribacter andamanensis AMV16 TaxID=1279009 RepID=M7P2M0_9BACT|nr:hypothetical protein [Cesiribacter andamanensis]EMR04779.1 hypothetical protein ADICEAN_00050 [Cesiribacter andamanensis AMV16]